MTQNRRKEQKRPETAREEVLREVEDAETRVEESEERRRRRGEAADTITPSRRAQEQSQGE